MFDDGAAETTGGASAGDLGAGTQVVYGREESGADNNDLASHGSGDGSQPGVETGAEVPDLTAEFDELIQDKYKEQFGAKVQEIIKNRFKHNTDYEGQVNQYKDAVAPLMQMYGLKADDIEGLTNAIQNDDGLLASRADAEGLTVDKYRQQLKLEMEAARGRDIQEAIENERQQREMFERWDAEAEQLKALFPNFDLAMEIKSTDGFGDYLDMGLSVEDAFYLTHKADIYTGANAQASKKAQEQTIQNFQQRAARPAENGLSKSPAVVRKTDPSKFSNDDVLEVIRRVQAGERIAF